VIESIRGRKDFILASGDGISLEFAVLQGVPNERKADYQLACEVNTAR